MTHLLDLYRVRRLRAAYVRDVLSRVEPPSRLDRADIRVGVTS